MNTLMHHDKCDNATEHVEDINITKSMFSQYGCFPPRYFISPTYKYVKVNIKKLFNILSP